MYYSGHIKGAINIDAFKDNLSVLLSDFLHYKTVVVYCTLNKRSEKIIETLHRDGYNGLIELGI